jgi:hypothetical protein
MPDGRTASCRCPFTLGVIAGLDPAIHFLERRFAFFSMDARVEPAHDERIV